MALMLIVKFGDDADSLMDAGVVRAVIEQAVLDNHMHGVSLAVTVDAQFSPLAYAAKSAEPAADAQPAAQDHSGRPVATIKKREHRRSPIIKRVHGTRLLAVDPPKADAILAGTTKNSQLMRLALKAVARAFMASPLFESGDTYTEELLSVENSRIKEFMVYRRDVLATLEPILIAAGYAPSSASSAVSDLTRIGYLYPVED